MADGRDVERPRGNLLCRFGFTREPSPDRVRPSRYTWSAQDRVIVLWPCGMLLAAAEGECLLLRGHAPLQPGRAELADMLDPREVLGEREHATPCPIEAPATASRWSAGYEGFIACAASVGHGVPRPDSAPSLAPQEPWSLVSAWDDMARLAQSICRTPR